MQAVRGSSTRAAAAQARSVPKPAAAPQQQPVPRAPVQQLLQAAAGAALSLAVLAAPLSAPALAATQGLADLVRDDYAFIDADGDGVISADDLRKFNAGVSADEGLPAIGDGQLEFSMKLFDLNQDGTLTAEELLRSLALDGAVDEDAVDAGVVRVFDANGNGAVDSGEWHRGLGDLGDVGEGAKTYVFDRVNRLTDSNGQLSPSDFGTALVLMRTVVLGY